MNNWKQILCYLTTSFFVLAMLDLVVVLCYSDCMTWWRLGEIMAMFYASNGYLLMMANKKNRKER